MKQMFVRYISHEIRTPLNVMVVGLDLLRDQLLDEEVDESTFIMVEEVKTSCSMALEILNELLSYESFDSGLMSLRRTLVSAWSLLEPITKAYAVQARHAGVRLRLFREGDGALSLDQLKRVFVKADKNKICQVYRCLLSNALKFSKEGDLVTLRVQVLGENDLAMGQKRVLRVIVSDTGIGMTPDRANKLFTDVNPGVGLWLCKTIMALHQGTISGSSAGVGCGTTFTVDLPFALEREELIRAGTRIHITGSESGTIRTSRSRMNSQSQRVPHRRHSDSHRSRGQASSQKSNQKHRRRNRHSSLNELTSGNCNITCIRPIGSLQKSTASSSHHSINSVSSPFSVPLTSHIAVPDLVGPDSDPDQRARIESDSSVNDESQGDEETPLKEDIRVLIVDDVPMNRRMLHRIVTRNYNLIEEAVDGEDAVEKFKQAKTENAPYGVILMDFQMPNMDGPTATDKIRKMGFKGPIIGVTGNAMPADIDVFIAKGANKVLIKPVDVKTLDETIEEELSRSYDYSPIEEEETMRFSLSRSRSSMKSSGSGEMLSHMISNMVSHSTDRNLHGIQEDEDKSKSCMLYLNQDSPESPSNASSFKNDEDELADTIVIRKSYSHWMSH
eukprot:CAMPEP_0182417558 /NCGR_PEP_ID=MMETSP1167-20130531/2026_1 /TAXON_ID=2988 /ORGANISM="Mallomonas Sp, Strain CCMP3275" /LENGTH=615 /DNA_ID=CAMNT_0024591209 /DNA_START=561 /DNA_END=2408 /DNA_ORIENTATION=-